MLGIIAATAMLGVSLAGDAWSAGDRLRAPTPGPTWLQRLEALGPRPGDLVLSSETEALHFYLGQSDFYVLPEGNDEGITRFTYSASGGVRSAYTDAIVLGRRGDFERLVERPHAGRDLWIIGPAGSMVDRLRRLDPDLWPSLVRSADVTVRTPDRWVLLKVRLPMEPASPRAEAASRIRGYGTLSRCGPAA